MLFSQFPNIICVATIRDRFADRLIGPGVHDFDRPSGTGPLRTGTQALRAWLLSACPSGTVGAIKHPKSALTSRHSGQTLFVREIHGSMVL
jgi:hypothetical protein